MYSLVSFLEAGIHTGLLRGGGEGLWSKKKNWQGGYQSFVFLSLVKGLQLVSVGFEGVLDILKQN